MKRPISQISFSILALVLFLSFSSNPPQRRSGAPDEGGCNNSGCHSGGGTINGTILLDGLPEEAIAGMTYPIDILMIRSNDNALRGGFQMTSLDADGIGAGTWSDPMENTAISELADRPYVEHQPAAFFEDSDTIRYGASWTAPESSTSDQIEFYVGAVFANGNNGRSGDRVIFTSERTTLMSNALSVTADIIEPSCNNQNGSITLNISNQVDPLSIEWNTGDNGTTLQNIGPGNYSVIVSDANDQIYQDSFVVIAEIDEEPPRIMCNTTEFNISSCVPFSYPRPTAEDNCSDVTIELLEGLGSNQPFPIGESIEVYQASDQSGNIAQCSIRIINDPSIDVQIDVQNITCDPTVLGSAMVIANGPNEPYDVQLEEGSLDQLEEGFHTIIVTDNTGCQTQRTFEVTATDQLMIDTIVIANASNAEAGDGSISIQISGGLAPYMFQWFTEDELFSTDENLHLLFPGDYVASITDQNNCSVVTDTITVDLTSSLNNPVLSNKINIYPNPVIDDLHIINQSNEVITELRLFDIHGKLITDNMDEIHSQNAGLYYLVVLMESGDSAVKPIIKL